MAVKIQPIVEGHGELTAVGILFRRLLREAGVWDIEIAKPIRRPRSQLTQRKGLAQALRLARIQSGSNPVFILFDGDDDCPAELGPRVRRWAGEEAADIPCEVVVAHREYEARFLGAIESLRGERGIRPDAASHPSPETPRDAKGELEKRMRSDMSYAETTDQAPLTALFSFQEAYRRCRSFRKLAVAFEALLRTAGRAPVAWPPTGWAR